MNNQLTIPPENEQFLSSLKALIRSGSAIALVGAGSSGLAGFPVWQPLLDRFEQELIDDKVDLAGIKSIKEAGELDSLASEYKKLLNQPKYDALIGEIFGRQTCDETHRKLVQLPFLGFFTTNYDQVLEYALHSVHGEQCHSICLNVGNNWTLGSFVRTLNYPENEGNICKVGHLHGVFDNPSSIILTREDYERFYGSSEQNWSFNRRFVWSLMSTRRLVYIGFSMNDPFIRQIHSVVSREFGNFGGESHYILLGLNTANEESYEKQLEFSRDLKRRFGIQPVFFEEDGNYRGLSKFIYEVYHELVSVEKSVDKTVVEPTKESTKSIAVKVNKDSLKNRAFRVINETLGDGDED